MAVLLESLWLVNFHQLLPWQFYLTVSDWSISINCCHGTHTYTILFLLPYSFFTLWHVFIAEWHDTINHTVETFLQTLDLDHPLMNIFKTTEEMRHFTHYMAPFYGYSPHRSDLDEFLLDLDRIFEVVVVFEMLEQSLVMLRRKLCWQVRYVLTSLILHCTLLIQWMWRKPA